MPMLINHPIMSGKLRPATDRHDFPFHSIVGDGVLDVPFHSFVGDGILAKHAELTRCWHPESCIKRCPAIHAIFVRRNVPNTVGVSIRNDYPKSMINCIPCLNMWKFISENKDGVRWIVKDFKNEIMTPRELGSRRQGCRPLHRDNSKLLKTTHIHLW